MKEYLRKNIWKLLIIAADLLLIPGMFFCHWLSDRMLAVPSVCEWMVLGGKCITCGGTHFVNSITVLRIGEAFHHNEYLFLLTVYFGIAFILLNLWQLCGLQFPKKVLRHMFGIPAVVILAVLLLIFLFARNTTMFSNIIQFILFRLGWLTPPPAPVP